MLALWVLYLHTLIGLIQENMRMDIQNSHHFGLYGVYMFYIILLYFLLKIYKYIINIARLKNHLRLASTAIQLIF